MSAAAAAKEGNPPATAPDERRLRIPLPIGIVADAGFAGSPKALARAIRSVLKDLYERYPSTDLIVISALTNGIEQLAADIAEQSGAQICNLPAESRAIEFIAANAVILLAIWDGVTRNETSAAIELQRSGVPRGNRDSLDPPEGGKVIHVVIPTVQIPAPANAYSVQALYPDIFDDDQDRAREYFDRILERIASYNKIVQNGGEPLNARATTSASWVIPADEQPQLSSIQLISLRRFAVADAIANSDRERTRDLRLQLHAAVFAAFTLFALFAHMEDHPRKLIVASAVVVILAIFLLRRHSLRDCDTRYQDHRALAEGLRVSFFWKLAGVQESVAEYYFGTQRSELDWIRVAIRAWDLTAAGDPRALGGLSLPQALGRVVERWLVDQQRYFTGAGKRDEAKAEQLHLATRVWMYLMLLIGGIRAVIRLDKDSEWQNVFIIAIDLLLALGALAHSYRDRMAYAEHVKQYSRMATIHANAKKKLDVLLTANQTEDAARVVFNLGREALAENGAWVLLHRERPLELPHP